ncbi:putative peptidoglycan binding protein [Albidovulum inexpectatum]|uniref:Putative peptidoglycan binding protein n=1 Tax=Albidovulum inexpectatum TaxID=196587 RepID=A0A2S5JLG9_9RHOB|nr:peptidoglycan-binding domain-containing protein [Albidovulum inexpectatum]PPB82334.1 putative peptidoglycan binding protein [Albidovulum inexpectatum]
MPILKKTRNGLIAAIAAGAMISATAVPAQAWGKKEQNLLKGLAAAAIVGAMIMNSRQGQAQTTRQGWQPAPAPTYRSPAPRYESPARYEPPATPRYRSGIHDTAAARAFNALSLSERKLVQTRLADWDYYHGAIDGTFGPMTYRAVSSYATDTTGTAQLETTAGAFGFYDSIIR